VTRSISNLSINHDQLDDHSLSPAGGRPSHFRESLWLHPRQHQPCGRQAEFVLKVGHVFSQRNLIYKCDLSVHQSCPKSTTNGVAAAAQYVSLFTLRPSSMLFTDLPLTDRNRFIKDGYTPRTWHTHPLHLCPPEPYDPTHPGTRATLDWIFLISSLNFSFCRTLMVPMTVSASSWREGLRQRATVVHTGILELLVAALDRGMSARPVSLLHVVLITCPTWPDNGDNPRGF